MEICLKLASGMDRPLPQDLSEIKRSFRPRYALLSENGDVLECDLMTWAHSMGEDDGYRRIRQEDLAGGYWLSTVFLGLNHNYSSEGPPLWFETMIFAPGPVVSPLTGKVHNHGEALYCERYSTMAEALAGHAQAKAWFERQGFNENGTIIEEPCKPSRQP